MRNRRICLLMLAVMAAMCLLPAAGGESAAEDPVIVRVGKAEYPLSLARYSLASVEEMSAMGYAGAVTGDREETISSVIENLVHMGIIENKLMDEGKHTLTESETDQLNAYAQNLYQSVWENFKEQLTSQGYEAEDRAITEWMETDLGLTLDVVQEEALAQVWIERILALYCGDVAISTQEIRDYLEENYLRPDREAYANDIPRYEQEILLAGNESFYTPEGYRRIRQIRLDYPGTIVKQLNALAPDWEEQVAAMQEAREKIADAVIAGEDPEAPKQEYLAAEEKKQEIDAEIARIEAAGAEMLRETTDEIFRRLEAGEEFAALAMEYGDGQGAEETWFHPQSEQWESAFREAAAALQNPGDVSQPVAAAAGVWLIQYTGDVEGGEHPLSEEEEKALEAAAYRAKQLEALDPMIEEWRSQYEIETHPEMLEGL